MSESSEATAAAMRADAEFLVGGEFYAKYRDAITNSRAQLHNVAQAQWQRCTRLDCIDQGLNPDEQVML